MGIVMRIAIGAVSHETNTFAPGPTTVEMFQAREWLHGEQIIAAHGGVRDDLGGMLDAARELGVEVVATFSASTEPSGTIARETFERLRDELLAGIDAAGPVDAICLCLHGAGVAEGVDDLEGALLTALRERVGPETPIIVTLDLHGNITPEMLEAADILLGCHLYPHTDMYDRGIEAVHLARRMATGELRPASSIVQLPMLISAYGTSLSPAKEVNEICWEWERVPGMIDCAFFHGFPYTDLPFAGVSVVATSAGDPELARRAAEDTARRIWDMRARFVSDLPDAADAVAQAVAHGGRPVVIAESSDNPGGGAPGDGTHLLRAMLDAGLREACFGYIYDPETAAQAHAAGVGATIDARIGGKTDTLHGAPVEARAYVKCLTDGRFRLTGALGTGMPVDLGRMARLVIDGIDVIVGSDRTQTLDDALFVLHGIDVRRYAIVALKSSMHFRAGFEPLAAAIIRTDTPGATTTRLEQIPYTRLRPVWPFDARVTFP